MEKNKLKGMVFAALFAALTAAVAWFKIPLPFTPVPITLKPLTFTLSEETTRAPASPVDTPVSVTRVDPAPAKVIDLFTFTSSV